MCRPTDTKGRHGKLGLAPMRFKVKNDPREECVRQNTRLDRWTLEMGRPHRLVEHHYHDHTKDKCDPLPDPIARGGVMVPFPVKLHEILDHIEEDGLADVISWQPHGRCFVVHKPEEFVEEVMPLYFKQKKFASFQRQLNLYGFQRLTRGADKGGYYHELFLRGKEALAHKIHRMRIKGTGVRPRSDPENEPDFYSMPFVDADCEATSSASSTPHPEKTTSAAAALVTPNVSPETTAANLKKVPSALFSMETMASTVIPFETTSCLISELQRPQRDDEVDDDDVIMFEGKPFHYLDPFKDYRVERLPPLRSQVRTATPCPDEHDDTTDLFSEQQMDALMALLNRPGGLFSGDMEAMNEQAFGDLLESVVQHR